MAIYRIQPVSENLEYCLVNDGGIIDSYGLIRGLPFERPSDDFRDIEFTINEDEFGLELTDLLGSTNLLLFLRDSAFEYLAKRLSFDPIETHRFRLLNERGRVHSDEYVIVNPLAPAPCLSLQHADFLTSKKSGKILRISKFVLERDKIPPRDLFRIAEKPSKYFVTQNFVDAVREAGYTNFMFEEIPLV